MRNTPWGIAEGELEFADGIVLCSTGVHGGIWLSSERQAELGYNQNCLNTAEWWGDDRDWAVPFAFFCEEIWKHYKQPGFEYILKQAIRTVRREHPAMLPVILDRHRTYSRHRKEFDSLKKSDGMLQLPRDKAILIAKGGSA